MPGGTPETDPLRQPQNPLGTRSEINHTINWVRSHLEHDPKVSIPKQDVYNDYIAYCERVDIKPLSTADFGKVMKQVFPEIRPRRLGTRGHSRYCYAAMRKATKLDPPTLPDLGVTSQTSDFNGVMDEDSWKIIKLWAEGLLNATFDNLKDLSTHITKHHLNTPASNSSRLLLQKKLLQREAKEKRKFVESGPMKKRRKKKRRSSSSSESVPQQQSTANVEQENTLVSVKTEIIDPIPNTSTSGHLHHQHQAQQQMVTILQPPPQQMLPMNLATEHDTNNQRKTQGTNLGCDNDLVAGCSTKTVAQNMSPVCTPTAKLLQQQPSIIAPSSVKEELPDDYDANVLCKKVRQAHQAKGLWNPIGQNSITSSIEGNPNNTLMPSPDVINPPSSNAVNYPAISNESGLITVSAPHPTDVNMIPLHQRSDINPLNKNLLAPSPMLLRARKLRYLHSKLENAHDELQGNENTDKDVLPDNLGLPRERVISICNMDKHELDDYLNGEDNSQDQEAELLQYFQQEENDKINNNSNSNNNNNTNNNANNINHNNNISGSHGPGNTQNILSAGPETNPGSSYSGYMGSRLDKRSISEKDQEDIRQLRFYLHQNLQNPNKSDIDGRNTLAARNVNQQNQFSSNIYTGPTSAAASLTMMSQRHLVDESINLRCCNPNNADNNNAVPTSYATVLRGPRRKLNLASRTSIPNSPNTKRKNFSFVPISPNNSQTQHNSVDYSPFVSPRSTPIVRKAPMLHKQHSLPLSDHNISDPMISSTRTNFVKGMNNMMSASAPPSPSLIQQRFHFVPNSSTNTGNGLMPIINGPDQQYNNTFQTVSTQCRNQNSNDCGPDSTTMLENRSQSVPLHCRSPIFNQTGNFIGYSSACNSVAQTPVPPEFTDFSDPSTILDIFSDASQPQPVKLESTDMASTLLDVDIASADSGINDLLSNELDSKINTIVSSRSVPSTPLPMFNYKSTKGIMDTTMNGTGVDNSNTMSCNNNGIDSAMNNRMNKMYDISKSVPTTPIAMNMTPFRYSPEFNRDFLINGNTVEPVNSTALSYYGASNGDKIQCSTSSIVSALNTAISVATTNTTVSSMIPSPDEKCIINSGSVIAPPTSLTGSLNESIEELSSFGDVTESIINTDLLGNL